MIKSLLTGILKIIVKVLNIVLLPINLLIENIFPDMTTSIQAFNNFVNTYLGSTLTYFFHILPPIFRSILVVWLTFVISYYTVYYTYITLMKIWNIIQKIKFW